MGAIVRERSVVYVRKELFLTIGINSYLIVCPLLFLAGLVDAIGGGGGLVSLPAYLLAGLPVHTAVATNKLSSSCGTAVAAGRFMHGGLVNWLFCIPAVICAVVGSSLGAYFSMSLSEQIMLAVLAVMIPVSALLVLNKKLFNDNGNDHIASDRKTMLVGCAAALIIGFYDGFYGPGTGTFLIVAFTVFAKMSVQTANAQTKMINLTTNVTSLAIFLMHGQVLISLGLAAAVCNMLGGYIGAGMVMKNGSAIVKPTILLVLALLVVKTVWNYL